MAIQNIDLSAEIRDWKNAICGEEVRAANVSAFEKIQGSVNDAILEVNQAAIDAQRASEDAENAIDLANRVLTEATSAKDIAVEKAEQASEDAQAAREAADKAQLYADLVVPTFTVDFMTGHLMYTDTEDLLFNINTTSGNLEYMLAA